MLSSHDLLEIEEGNSLLLIPRRSIEDQYPPRQPAFFNTKAKLNRDLSILIYSAFAQDFEGPKIFLEGFSGIGARGVRVANEIKGIEKVVANDLNPNALEFAKRSSRLNQITNMELSENEVCYFFSSFSKRGSRGSIVDLDPFGSPVKYLDCALRATTRNGIFSCTATDLQVLRGIFPKACKRKYGGIPIKTEYGNEIAIRLILGCILSVAGRLDTGIEPIFVESDMHYYRTYVRVVNKSNFDNMFGFIGHCFECGNRQVLEENQVQCNHCKQPWKVAGPMWIGQLFEKEFVQNVSKQLEDHAVDKRCESIIKKSIYESDKPALYYTLDEIAAMKKCSPPKLHNFLERLKNNGYSASPTSLNPTGFRTDAKINVIRELFV